MKEATGEVSMTVVTLVAIAVIGGILAFLWPQVKNRINTLWNKTCPDGSEPVNGICGDGSDVGNGGGSGRYPDGRVKVNENS